MVPVTLLLALFAFVNGDEGNDTNSFYPNCDLVAISHVDLQDHENGTLDIDFSWERKSENYDAIGSPIRMYVVRHGPLVNGELSNTSEIIQLPFPDKDEFTLSNVKPYESYGLQVCAVTTSYKFLFQNDLWSRAWIGSMNLGPNRWSDQQPPPSEAEQRPEEPAPTTSFRPECDLVQTSYVDVGEENGTDLLKVRFSWDKKQTSYERVGTVEGYTTRYGPVSGWGKQIEEDDARYLRVGSENDSFVLHNIQRGTYYGLQICAVTNDTFDEFIDWEETAWLGTMDFTIYSEDAKQGPLLAPVDENTATDGNDTFTDQCDLVQDSFIAVDDNPQSLTIHFYWDKKESSYQAIDSILAYQVRYGRQQEWGSGIEESDANYMITTNDTSFSIPDVPRGSYYGIQICALTGTDDDQVDWRKEAWLGSMDFTNYTPAAIDDLFIIKEVDEHKGSSVTKTHLGLDYTILLAVLAALTIIFIIGAFAWLAMRRKRQSIKPAPMVFVPAMKQGAAFP